MKSFDIEYLDNGISKRGVVYALSPAMAEDVFCETYGEDLEIIRITLTPKFEVA
jgi:hypothetical protein